MPIEAVSRPSLELPSDRPSPHDDLRNGEGPPPNTSKALSRMEEDTPPEHIFPKTTLLAGKTGKAFIVHTDLLIARSPYFRDLLSPSYRRHHHNPTTKKVDMEHSTISFPDLDEFAFALFFRWLYGAQLAGPTDVHTMDHCMSLYILSCKFEIEKLQNQIMDLVRNYYRGANTTAPASRLEFVYEKDEIREVGKMKTFLVETAALRIVAEGGLSETMRVVVRGGGEVAVDLMGAVARLASLGGGDARTGIDCVWHVHKVTRVCKRRVSEAWQD